MASKFLSLLNIKDALATNQRQLFKLFHWQKWRKFRSYCSEESRIYRPLRRKKQEAWPYFPSCEFYHTRLPVSPFLCSFLKALLSRNNKFCDYNDYLADFIKWILTLKSYYSKAGFTHANFVGRLKIFKISKQNPSKNRGKICNLFTDFSKSEKSLHWSDFLLAFAWSFSKIGRQSWRV